IIEKHDGAPMDIEWAKGGDDGEIYIVQARREAVNRRQTVGTMERYRLEQKGTELGEGRSIGQRIRSGKVRMVNSIKEMDKV
ncbi:PEP/pyruvate-binding domain-containing protein, partial [Acinetobacter baumannii]|uniref:PEP/pyruvate-binding domain-containing protein n=1 Tax=Acinetobacter baumannii TaxID=470 RepID=UPI0027D338E6